MNERNYSVNMMMRIMNVKKCTECGINPASSYINDVFGSNKRIFRCDDVCCLWRDSYGCFLQIKGRRICLGIKNNEVKTLARLEERHQQDKGGTTLSKKDFENLSVCLVSLLTLYLLKKEMAPFRGFYFRRQTCFFMNFQLWLQSHGTKGCLCKTAFLFIPIFV